MNAVLLEKTNQPLTLSAIETPEPRPGQVRVKIRAAGLNHRDVWVQKGLYPGMSLPVVPGSDGVGIVEALGEGVDDTWLHREVIINPAMGWGNAERSYNPRTFRILGMPDHGTFAEYVCLPAEQLFQKPVHLSDVEAAVLGLAGLTAWRAVMSRGKLSRTDRVLISGIGGGVALFALQFAVANGNQVFVTSGSNEKISRAVAAGAKGGISYLAPQWHRELAQTSGLFDLVVDSAGGPEFGKLVDLAQYGGRIVFYGGTRGNISELVPARVFFKQLDLKGSTMGSPTEFRAMLEFITQHQLHPFIDRVFPLSEAEAAFRYLEEGGQFGKVVLEVS